MVALFLSSLIGWNLFFATAEAKEQSVWIKAPLMPFNEFSAEMQSLGSPHISYAEYLLKETRQRAKSYKLKEKLLVAQELYLSGEGERALKAFQEITKGALSADWDKEDRRIILYSFLRRAQSEHNLEKRKALLLSAIHFNLYPIKKSNYPDYDLFPPPLMEELKLLQEKTNPLHFHRKSIFPQHEIVLINGQLINESIKINQGSYRVSAFSSSRKAWLKNLNLSDLITQKINTAKLTQGACNNLQISENFEERELKIFPYSKCPKANVLGLKKEETEKKPNSFILANFSEKNRGALNPNSPSFFNSQEVEMANSKKSLSHLPPWLFIGAGIVATGILLSLSNNSKSKDSSSPGGNYIY